MSPQGVGKRSKRSISTLMSVWSSTCWIAYIPAGPDPTTATLRDPTGARPVDEIAAVGQSVVLPFSGQAVETVDGSDRAYVETDTTADTLLRVDVHLFGAVKIGILRPRTNAVDRADLDARV